MYSNVRERVRGMYKKRWKGLSTKQFLILKLTATWTTIMHSSYHSVCLHFIVCKKSRLLLYSSSLGQNDCLSQINPIIRTLHWLPVAFRSQFKIISLTYRALQSQPPAYMGKLLRPYSSAHPLRSNMLDLLSVSRTQDPWWFKTVALKLWKILPAHLYHAASVDSV